MAARSYVLNHKNEFAARGYDICATQACQVYRGRASEHEMTDRAVAQTRGVIATWRGQLRGGDVDPQSDTMRVRGDDLEAAGMSRARGR